MDRLRGTGFKTKGLVALGLLVLVNAGCPTADPAAGRAVGVPAGTYVGENTCLNSIFYRGDVYTIKTTTESLTRTFSSTGLPVSEGTEVFVGMQELTDTGRSLYSQTLTSIALNPSEVVLAGESQELLECDNTCVFGKKDGTCDEVLGSSICGLGMDCLDCGPFAWDTTWTTTYRFLESGIVERTYAAIFAQASSGEVRGYERIMECTALLSR